MQGAVWHFLNDTLIPLFFKYQDFHVRCSWAFRIFDCDNSKSIDVTEFGDSIKVKLSCIFSSSGKICITFDIVTIRKSGRYLKELVSLTVSLLEIKTRLLRTWFRFACKSVLPYMQCVSRSLTKYHCPCLKSLDIHKIIHFQEEQPRGSDRRELLWASNKGLKDGQHHHRGLQELHWWLLFIIKQFHWWLKNRMLELHVRALVLRSFLHANQATNRFQRNCYGFKNGLFL